MRENQRPLFISEKLQLPQKDYTCFIALGCSKALNQAEMA